MPLAVSRPVLHQPSCTDLAAAERRAASRAAPRRSGSAGCRSGRSAATRRPATATAQCAPATNCGCSAGVDADRDADHAARASPRRGELERRRQALAPAAPRPARPMRSEMPNSPCSALPTKRELHVERLVEPEFVRQPDRGLRGGRVLAEHQLHRVADVLEQRERDERDRQHHDERLQQAADDEGGHRRMSAADRAAAASVRRSVDVHPPHAQPVVGAVGHVDVLAHRPRDDLLVQRDVGDVARCAAAAPRGSSRGAWRRRPRSSCWSISASIFGLL